MDTWVILLIIGLVFALLAVGGFLAVQRRMEQTEDRFDEHLRQVNEELAAAHAQDRGWERSALEEAARQAYVEQRPGSPAADMTLVQVIDRPGTDEDKAVFRFLTGDRQEHLTLGRRDGAWVFESLG